MIVDPARLSLTADMNPRLRIATGLVPVWRISVDPSDTEADRGFSADADSVLIPTRPRFSNLLLENPITAITLHSSSGPLGTNTLKVALGSLSSKLCHFDTHPPRYNSHLLIKLFLADEAKRRHQIRLLDYNIGNYRRLSQGSESRFTMEKLVRLLLPRCQHLGRHICACTLGPRGCGS